MEKNHNPRGGYSGRRGRIYRNRGSRKNLSHHGSSPQPLLHSGWDRGPLQESFPSGQQEPFNASYRPSTSGTQHVNANFENAKQGSLLGAAPTTYSRGTYHPFHRSNSSRYRNGPVPTEFQNFSNNNSYPVGAVSSNTQRANCFSKINQKSSERHTFQAEERPTQPHLSTHCSKSDHLENLLQAARSGNHIELKCLLESPRTVPPTHLSAALLEACKNGSKFLVHQLVHAGASVNNYSKSSTDTPLHVAARGGYVDIANFLLSKGAKVEAMGNNSDTPLMAALRSFVSSGMLMLLVENNARVNARNVQSGNTPLMFAVEAMDIDAMRILLHNNADIKVKNKKKETARNIAERLCIAEIFDSLVHEKKGWSSTPVTNALRNNNLEAVKMLLDCRYPEQSMTVNKEETSKRVSESFREKTLQDLVNQMSSEATPNKGKPHPVKLQIAEYLLANSVPGKGKNKDFISLHDLTTATKAGIYELVELMCRYKEIGKKEFRYDGHSRRPIMIAAEAGRADILRVLLRVKDLDPTYADSNYNTALSLALYNGHLECGVLLLQNKDWLPSGFLLKKTAEKIVSAGQTESLKLLWDCCDLSDVKQTLLLPAVTSLKVEMVKLLLDRGTDIDFVNNGDTALTKAMRIFEPKLMEEMVEFLLERGANVKRREGTESPIVCAVSQSTKVVRMLLDKGADVNETEELTGATALIKACWESKPLMLPSIELLLEAGADINKADSIGQTALHKAASSEKGDLELVHFLLTHGADTEAKDSEGQTSLHVAAVSGNRDVITKLRDHGANMAARDNAGNSAFLKMVQEDDANVESLTLLAECPGNQINSCSLEGDTSLMLAAKASNYQMISTLLKLGADIHAMKEESGEKVTALSIALDSGQMGFKHLKTIEELVKAGGLASVPRRCCLSLYQMIMSDRRSIVQLMVTHGMAPLCVDFVALSSSALGTFLLGLGGTSIGRTLSPFAAALVRNRASVAKYLLGNWFLTPADVVGSPQTKELKLVLQATGKLKGVEVLENHLSQPMSLKQLAFVTVSSRIGEMEGREKRVKETGLPPYWQDRLMFRHEYVTMDTEDEDQPHRYGPDDESSASDTDYSDYDDGDDDDYDFNPFYYYDSDEILGLGIGHFSDDIDFPF